MLGGRSGEGRELFFPSSDEGEKKSAGGGGGENIRDREGGWGEEREGRRPLAACCGAESSLLTVVAAAAGDEPFGSTTDRGYDERRRCTMRIAANGLAIALDFFRYSNKLLKICKIVSMFLLFIEFFVSVGSSKTLHGLSYFVSCSSVFSMPL